MSEVTDILNNHFNIFFHIFRFMFLADKEWSFVHAETVGTVSF